ncbi:MAG TPA: 1-deoxy-D-xylulose-5-phosphate reductoisomerase [Longimicrobiaceae bacterium]|nr:1-deoxy-D-xylulose-5-phosphate reductoisomerase [Longimicrobiaceae bacterium]
MTGVVILGATGSIGLSTLAVLSQHRDRFRLVGVTANRNATALSAIVDEWEPKLAVLADDLVDRPASTHDTRWAAGSEALLEAATHPDADVVVNALVGAAGLEPTLAALRAGKRVALANKESLVCGGALVLDAAREGGGELIPVDSEHSAILQCLRGSRTGSVERLILTASGGPFRDCSPDALAAMKPEDALRHPTWDMGAKVTIDSATLANKALEVIEAHHLFGIPYSRIEAVVHPQSIVHSFVEFVDGSVLAQVGFPTMETPIVYALSFPERLPYRSRRFDPIAAGELTFQPVRAESFPAYSLGRAAGETGGTAPAVYNAANEVAVSAFLASRIGFCEIADAIGATLDRWSGGSVSSLQCVLDADRWARETAETYIRDRVLC